MKGIHRLHEIPLLDGRCPWDDRCCSSEGVPTRASCPGTNALRDTAEPRLLLISIALGELSAEPSLLIISTGFRDAAQTTHLLNALDNLNSCPCRAILPNRSTRGCDTLRQDADAIAAWLTLDAANRYADGQPFARRTTPKDTDNMIPPAG